MATKKQIDRTEEILQKHMFPLVKELSEKEVIEFTSSLLFWISDNTEDERIKGRIEAVNSLYNVLFLGVD